MIEEKKKRILMIFISYNVKNEFCIAFNIIFYFYFYFLFK